MDLLTLVPAPARAAGALWARTAGLGTRYLTSLYWAFTTASTVGYGDITPKTVKEKVSRLTGGPPAWGGRLPSFGGPKVPQWLVGS